MQKAIALLESVVDLQLGNIDMDQWLRYLADQTGADAAFAVSWQAQQPDLAEIYCSDKRYAPAAQWLSAMDRIISVAAPKEPALLDTIARSAGLLESSPHNLLDNPAWMIGFVDSTPANMLVGLHSADRPRGWRKPDRNIFSELLPVLFKANLLYKKTVLYENRLKISNKVLDTLPRGIIGLTPAGEIVRKNIMARDLLNRDGGVTEKNGTIKFRDERIALQFQEKLAQIRAMPPDSLENFVWNKSFRTDQTTDCYQLSLHAYPLRDWRPESYSHDRFVLLYLSANDFTTLPTASQLGDFYDLTATQAKLVIALMKGKTSEEAAAQLNISINTIRNHLQAIYAKLGTDTKAGLIRIVSTTLVDYSSGQ